MIVLDVYFNNNFDFDGQALLEENLITNKCKLLLKSTLFISETKCFIDKATELLKQRYENVKVDIHWQSLNTICDNKMRKVENNERK